jgi:hypothetical protein
MADRTSAGIFGEVFEYLARQPQSPERDAFARRMWDLQGNYDFSPYQMDADDALVVLGLARREADPQYNDEDTLVYGPPE